ncbi:MAG: YihY/virulence factor BrkB family protein [Nocardioidaceae bacterium]
MPQLREVVRRADDVQRRRRSLGMPLAVVYKFFDDQGNYLAAIITYYAFVAIFPLLLIASSVLGFLLQGDEHLKDTLLTSALSQFPVVGTQLGRPEGLHGSASAVLVGGLTALYGILGLGQAAQNALNATWAIPRNSRLNPIHSRVRSFFLLGLGGLSVLAVAVLSSLVAQLGLLGSGTAERLVVAVPSVALTALVLAVMMSLATSHRHRLRTVLPGSVAIAVMWQVLQVLGAVYVSHVVSKVSEMNGVFALVLGLVAFIYVAGVMGVLGLEINVVLAKRLYPRALLTPFTDAVDLTPADRRVYTEYARAQRHKGFEHVEVSFGPRPGGD